jgi:hypothetical protein
MPYKIIRFTQLSTKRGYKRTRCKVVNMQTGKLKAKNTTCKKAKRQLRLLNYLEHVKPSDRSKTRRNKTK